MPNIELPVFSCYCVGDIHSDLVLQDLERVGRAINVFNTSINVKTDYDELLVVTMGKTRSPLNLNVSPGLPNAGGFSRFVRENGEATMTSGKGGGKKTVLQIDRVVISLDRYDIFQNSFQEPTIESLHFFSDWSDRVFSALIGEAQKERKGCLLNPDITTQGLLAAFLRSLASDTITGHNQDRMEKSLATLCGRGPGFTPAGDDFIAGYLAMFNWLGKALKVGLPVIPGEEFSRLTTWTSFKLMQHSAKGLVDDQAQAMLNSVATHNSADYINSIRLLGKRGHTSGIDFATGAAFGLYTTTDVVCKTKTLRDISEMLDLASGPALS